MDAPISHYFIFTGHNSYLTGNQLSSDCSEVPIIDALKKGVRVIELDIWPNSNKNDIDVLHGRTLTSPVELIKCLRAIKTHAFEVSDYPVVVTLEDHLTPELQSKVAEMVTEIFGEILFTPPVGESLKEFPSPNSLKRRIIISTKPPKEYKEGKDEDVVQKGKALGDEEVWGREVPSFIERNKSGDKDDLDDEEDNDEDDDVEKFKKNAPPQYKHLIAIHAGKPKGGITACLKVDPDKVRRLSLSEEQLEKAAEKYAKQIVRFTQQNLLRIYPKGTRVTSSNYNPLVGWSHGAQMVAFNMQGYGRSLWLMQGMFRANGGCGYIKKPDILLKGGSDSDIFDPKVTLPVKTTLRVTIYMGEGWYFDFRHTHFDQYSPPDFYTRVGIAGVPADTVMKKTKTLEDNWVPSWDEVFEFPLTVPELALLRLEVHEYDMSEKDDFGGQTCLPVWELQEGIRSFPLHSRKGEKYKSVKLLVRILCKFFIHGSCLKGEHCEYSHDSNVCTFYQKGICLYGSRCRNEHVRTTSQPQSLSPSNVPPPPQKGDDNNNNNNNNNDVCYIHPREYPICSFAAAGDCPRGSQCPHMHGDICSTCGKKCLHPFRPEEREEHTKECQKKQKHIEALKKSQEIECSVCLDRVLSKATPGERKFGLLTECHHPFCIQCIRNWRSSAPVSGMDVNSTLRACPICRKLSYFVVPSVVWYSTPDEKKEIIDIYKAKLRSINCKHFNFGNGNCPFGGSCFYKHAYSDGHLDEVVVRNLGSQEGETLIADSIRLSEFLGRVHI